MCFYKCPKKQVSPVNASSSPSSTVVPLDNISDTLPLPPGHAPSPSDDPSIIESSLQHLQFEAGLMWNMQVTFYAVQAIAYAGVSTDSISSSAKILIAAASTFVTLSLMSQMFRHQYLVDGIKKKIKDSKKYDHLFHPGSDDIQFCCKETGPGWCEDICIRTCCTCCWCLCPDAEEEKKIHFRFHVWALFTQPFGSLCQCLLPVIYCLGCDYEQKCSKRVVPNSCNNKVLIYVTMILLTSGIWGIVFPSKII